MSLSGCTVGVVEINISTSACAQAASALRSHSVRVRHLGESEVGGDGGGDASLLVFEQVTPFGLVETKQLGKVLGAHILYPQRKVHSYWVDCTDQCYITLEHAAPWSVGGRKG